MLPSGRRRVLAFVFAEELVGLAAKGRYVNTTRAVTSVSAYRLPIRALEALLRKDASLQYPFFCKVSQELREAQQLAIVLARRDAVGRVASFLQLLEREPTATRAGRGRIFIPMSRTDIADHLGLTLESVSRAFAELERRRIVHFPDARHVKVIDCARFREIVCAT
jgi:CRP-like cAMP-binding protein